MTPRNWPLFNEAAICPKCRGQRVRASWCPKDSHSRSVDLFARREGDWIERTCERCHYTWPEEPLDRAMS